MVSPINLNNNLAMQGSAPNMQGVPPNLALAQERLKEDVNNNIIVKKFESTEKPGLLLGLMLPLWLGIGQGMEFFNKKCAGEYKNSIPGKIGTWADSVGSNSFFQSKPIKSIENGFRASKIWITKNIINKSKILSAFANTPSKPEFSMARIMAKGTIGELANDARQVIDEHLKKKQSLAELGLNPTSIAKVNTLAPEKQAKIITNLKLKQIGLNKKTYAKISKDATEAVDDIIKAFSKVDKTKSVGIWRKIPVIGKVFGREVYFSEIVNKLQALKGSKNPLQVTTVGKALPKGLLRTIEGLTNGTAGGKLMIMMQAYIFADALIQSSQAPKGEKWKTFTERISQDLGYYLTMPLAINTMHRFGGLQYIGMSKPQIATYRQELNNFNLKAKTVGEFADKLAYNAERTKLKSMLKGNSKWFHKPFKKLGRILTVGLEQIRPFKSTKAAGKVGNVFKNAKYWFKQGAGWPMRFLAFGMIFGPFFSNLCVKASHTVFGRPTQSVLDKEKPTPTAAETPATPATTKTPMSPVETPLNTTLPTPQTAVQATPTKTGSGLLESYKANSSTTNPFTETKPPTTNATTTINTPMTNTTTSKRDEADYTYIPSSAGVIIDKQAPIPQDKVSGALARAEQAEKDAMKYAR